MEAVISESGIFLVSIPRLSMQTGLGRGTKPIHETKSIKEIMVRTVSANTGIWSRQLSFGWAFMSDARVHVLLLSICCSSKEHQKKFVHVVLMQCK